MLPDPTLTFTIPSLHDGTPLTCRIYHPSSPSPNLDHTSTKSHRGRRDAAILAHPYAPMGGSFDDPLVSLLGAQLLRRGFVLGTFNFRGAGRSAGRTSWTAKPERDDYASFVGFLVWYMHYSFTPRSTEGGAHVTETNDGTGSDVASPLLLMGGYSYGAMVTALLSPLQDLLARFDAPAAGSEAAQIRLLAASLAEQQRRGVHHHPEDVKLGTPSLPTSRSNLTAPNPAYLLVSPLRGLISHLATLSLLPTRPTHQDDAAEFKLAQHSTLAIFGDDDIFVPVGKLRAWAGDLAARAGSRFRYREVASAGHFWSQEGVLDFLIGAVDEFAGRTLGG